MILKHLKNLGPVLIVSAATLWALDGVVRRNLYSLPPITIVFFEHFTGTLILLPFVFKQILKIKITKKEFLLITFVSLLSGVIGTLFFTTALLKVNFISFSVVFLLQKLQPIFAITTAIIFLKEKVNKRFLIWGGLAFIAAYFVTFKNGIVDLDTGPETLTAALYALGAAAAWGSSTTFSKMVLLKLPDKITTALRFMITTVFAFIAVYLFRVENTLTVITFNQLLLFIFIALSTGMVALLIYYKGLKLTPVRVSTILELVFPVLAIIIDAVLYKTFLSPAQLLAAAVLLFSIYKISKLTMKHEI